MLKRIRDRWDDARLDEMAANPMKLEEWLTNLRTLPIGTRTMHAMSKKTKTDFHNLM
jgi:hypothetical protein